MQLALVRVATVYPESVSSQEQQAIGYSLPSNLLGSAGRDVPVPPWKALSLCIHDDCHTNPDKCYRATRCVCVERERPHSFLSLCSSQTSSSEALQGGFRGS